MFAEVACWCKHDCCEVTSEEELKALVAIGMTPPLYDCMICECHEISISWDDLGDWLSMGD